MLTLAIRYLNGWAMAAADGARKEKAEWPPHPDRVFMALAAAWFETGEDPLEGEALRWLEALPPPAIAATDATTRTGVTSYVPVNDARMGRKAPSNDDLGKLKDAGLAVLPEYRGRQPRGFPVAIPHDPVIHIIWQNADPEPHREALERLTAKITHIGHSASLVQAWLADEQIMPTLVPTEGVAPHRLRISSPGRLDALARACNRDEVLAHAALTAQLDELKGKEKKQMKDRIVEQFGNRPPVSLRPLPGRWQGYRAPQAPVSAVAGSVFDPQLIVLSIRGRRLSLPATLKLTEALRGTLMSRCAEQPPPEWLSGHREDGTPSSDPHLGLMPLPFVATEHADGRIMGLALALPRDVNPREAARCLEPFLRAPDTGLPSSHRLFDGRWLECNIEVETRERPPVSLSLRTWTRPSRTWTTVTPVVLDRHFSGKDKWKQATESVKVACERIGLPRPREVLLHPVSLAEGVPHAREFPNLIRKADGGRRYHSHAVILFDEPVTGPLLIGAGRFRGYGLCLPMDERDRDHV